MCSIVGLIDKEGEDVAVRLKKMLELTEHRGPDGSGVAVGSYVRRTDSLEELDVSCVFGESGFGHSRLKITGETGIQPLYSRDKRFILGFNGEIWNYRELKEALISGGHVFESDSDGEVIIHLIWDGYRATGNFIKSVSYAIEKLDGEYAFVVMDSFDNKFALYRDPVGVKQLYYGEDSRTFGFCSEKKPLLYFGLPCKRVLPGEIVCIVFYDKRTKIIRAYNKTTIPKRSVGIFDENTALASYRDAIFRAVEKRIEGQRKIGIIFSGGVDSVVIAKIASLIGADITCYAAGFPDSPDMLNARKSARELGFDLRVCEISENLINCELENIIRAIEANDHLQVDVAIPVFFAVKLAAEDGVRVLLTGQGADELFAGYSWYTEILKTRGSAFLNACLWNDVNNLYKDTLEREDKITMFHSTELRVPFLDPEVINVSMSISETLKIKDGFLKHIHRIFADSIGLPEFISWRPKEAAQHGSSVHKALLNLIRAKVASPTDWKGTTDPISGERLGSAHRYSDYHDVYKGSEDIQMALDSLGEKIGLVPLDNKSFN